jgi:hypothetical protein
MVGELIWNNSFLDWCIGHRRGVIGRVLTHFFLALLVAYAEVRGQPRFECDECYEGNVRTSNTDKTALLYGKLSIECVG